MAIGISNKAQTYARLYAEIGQRYEDVDGQWFGWRAVDEGKGNRRIEHSLLRGGGMGD